MAIEWQFISAKITRKKCVSLGISTMKTCKRTKKIIKMTNSYPSQCRIFARGLYSVALPPKLFNFGWPHSFACNASHFSTSCHAISLLALWILIMSSMSFWFRSSFFHFQPLRSIAFQNICWLGYTQNSLVPSGVTFGMVDVCRCVGNVNGWSGAGFWLAGGICLD